MRLYLIVLGAATLMVGAAQAQTSAATANVSLRAEVKAKCSFGSENNGPVNRVVNFGDITDVVGLVSISLADVLGGKLQLNCNSQLKGKFTLSSRDGGYLTPDSTLANTLDDNQKIGYDIDFFATSGAISTFVSSMSLDSGDYSEDHENSADAMSTELDLIFNIEGAKNSNGSYKYLVGVYTDVVTVTFTPSS